MTMFDFDHVTLLGVLQWFTFGCLCGALLLGGIAGGGTPEPQPEAS